MQTIFGACVGVSFRGATARDIVKGLKVGNKLLFEREPSNVYDKNAVRVIEPESGEFVGYLAKESNMEVADHLDNDLPYSCEVASFLTTIKPHLRINLYTVEEGNGEADGETTEPEPS